MRCKFNLNINSHLGCIGTFAERYVPGGYFDSIEFEDALKIMSDIEYLDGIDVWYPGHPLIDQPDKLKKKLASILERTATPLISMLTDPSAAPKRRGKSEGGEIRDMPFTTISLFWFPCHRTVFCDFPHNRNTRLQKSKPVNCLQRQVYVSPPCPGTSGRER